MKKILIIKSNQLGDTIVDLPMVIAAIKIVGATNVRVITTPIAKDLFSNLLDEENLLVLNRATFNGAWKKPFRFFQIWRWIREFAPDGVLIPYDQGTVARLLGSLSGAAVVITMANSSVRFSRLKMSQLEPTDDRSMHENCWDVFRRFTDEVGLSDLGERPLAPKEAFRLPDLPSTSRSKPRILLHSGSSREATRWGNERFTVLARLLCGRGCEVIWMQEGDYQPPLFEDLTILKRQPLMKFAEIAGGCDVFVGNNSGPMHLCDVLGLGLVVLCGPVAKRWDPFWSPHRVLIREQALPCQPCETWDYQVESCPMSDEPFACMSRPSVESVADKVLELLAELPSRQQTYDRSDTSA